jgi:primary-amine oxidase
MSSFVIFLILPFIDSSTSLKAANRPRINPPLDSADYLVEKLGPDNMRKDIKPLHVLQPEGVSFKLANGHVLEWQKWRMHVGQLNIARIRLMLLTYFSQHSAPEKAL